MISGHLFHPRRLLPRSLLGLCLAFATALVSPLSAIAAEEAVQIPAPALDMAPPARPGLQKAILAGGCFWGVQGVFQHVKGVERVVSGYSGGSASTADYELVSRGNTGHAEAVEISYDPAQVSYGSLLQIFFSVAHDPTQLNRQGPDVGTQYRSAIFATSAEQAKVAQAYVAQLDASGRFGKPIVTRIEARPSFFPAEVYHQDFMVSNPQHPYIAAHDRPKLDAFKRLFPGRYRADPVLVKAVRGVPVQ